MNDTGGGPKGDGSHPRDGWGIQEYEIEVRQLYTERDNWMETAAQNQRNTDFYRDLIIKIGEPFGVAAKTSDDGSVQDEVLALKVPDLVESLRAENSGKYEALKIIQKLSGDWYQGASEKKPGTVMMEIWAACNVALDPDSGREEQNDD